METNSTETLCTICTKAGCVAMCYGCQQPFCTRHFLKHRSHLAVQMDDLQEKYDLFKQDFDQDRFKQPLLSSIYAWERRSMKKIQEIAEKAREDLQQWMEKTKTKVRSSLDQMTIEFAANEKSNNFTETDIQRWTKLLEEFRNSLEKPSTISIVQEKKSSSSTICGIKLVEQATEISHSTICLSPQVAAPIPERFVSIFGPCQFSEDNRVVTHSNYRAGLSQITGKNAYSFGKYSINFLIENKGDKNIFLGIHSSLKQNSSNLDSSIFGWWNLNYVILNGESGGGGGGSVDNEMIETGDKITLIIDCDSRQIRLRHHRTKKFVQIPIPLEVCAFPWKILVRLLTTGDCVRIL